MSIVELKGITKIYNNTNEDVYAVKDFNLVIEENEFVVFVGPSGCGKTTTLRMIAGLEEITEGYIYINGKLVNQLMPKERDIAMVFQSYALYPYMSVYDNIAFGLRLRKFLKNEIYKKIYEVAKILGIEYLLKRWPKALSGGQKQRVAVGRAISRHPKVFLMDEPLSNLDAKMRAQMRVEIVKLHQKIKAAFIYVTHDQVEAMTMGTKIVVMNNGIIQQVDKPNVIYNKPANAFVGSFFGTPSMNLVKAVMIAENDNVFFRLTEVKVGRIKNIVKRVELERNLKVPAHKAKNMLNSVYIGKEVTLGIRPEYIYVASEIEEKYKDSAICAKVDILETLGLEKLLYAKVGQDIALTAKVKNNVDFKQNDEVLLIIDTSMVHVFDRTTGKTVFFGGEE